MKYFLIAGEASGDLHASNLMAALKKQDAEADFVSWAAILCSSRRDAGEALQGYGFMGFIPVLLNLRTILNNNESLPGGNPAVQARCGDPDRLSGIQFEDSQICKDAVGTACLLLYFT